MSTNATVTLKQLQDAYNKVLAAQTAIFQAFDTVIAQTGAIAAHEKAQREAERSCHPWCVRHDELDDELCFSADLPTPGGKYGDPGHVGLSYHPDTGIGVSIYHDTDATLTLDEAEQLAAALMRQIALGRGRATPNSPAPLALENVEGGCSDLGCRICKGGSR
ncbi:hypothetical protein [Nonomuraea sp. NPDC003754]